ncbi:ABC transporter ATP-binding protein [Microlunatus flavus]|uniref:ABC-2 type transport system ATP-binding protein/lipopolysaccharide transport system ATP-binding protein n=1 Tax=Microlunatus flavus TaxID=1036181 RepID=A0A1H9CWV4_9ACTN|nr:polysaccharide ABC transporter ATP-binding protein [Microlunatus flavus]SEQ05619.1 ABC-2 type transport system ATP-binding protein/lipopolysaccharide transport system ATP-binding protein [Microlunatus flavus]
MLRVELEHVSKRYRLGHRTNLREAITAAASRPLHGRTSRDELWSLRDVSLSVGDGEALGILGRNGAGKSTVLKILAGITAPTSGVSRTRGRVAPLLEVGTGFHPELTGRENVYLNGAVLGMSRRDITRRFSEIVEFSGVERFLDTPVKRYSSGMYLRLAFSVAAHLEPDVLVVDEILAVGDAEFQRRCLGRMQEAEQEGRTLVFVSHDLDSLARLCPRSVWLDAGEVRESGPSSEVVRHYLADGLAQGAAGRVLSAGPVTVHRVDVRTDQAPAGSPLLRDDPLVVEVDLELDEELPGVDLALYVSDTRSVRILDEALSDRTPGVLHRGRQRVRLRVPPMLNVGDFTVGLWVGTAHEDLVDEPAAATFSLHGHDRGRPDRVVVADLPFEVEPA